MGCLGVHFAVTEDQMRQLLKAAKRGDEALMDFVGEIEEEWDRQWLQESDKAWDPIHRALTLDDTGGGRLDVDEGSYPLCVTVMGGEHLYEGDDYSVVLIRPNQVIDLALALEKVNASWVRARLFSLPRRVFGSRSGIDDDDFDYMWSWFHQFPGFFRRAAAAGRAVIFTVDH